jgi:hypothetical protein
MGGMKVGIPRPKHGQAEASGEVLAVADDARCLPPILGPQVPILLAPQTFRLAKPFITIIPKGDLARFHVILIFGQSHRPLYLHLFV